MYANSLLWFLYLLFTLLISSISLAIRIYNLLHIYYIFIKITVENIEQIF